MLNIIPMDKVKSSLRKLVREVEIDLLTYKDPVDRMVVEFGPVTNRPGYTIPTNYSLN